MARGRIYSAPDEYAELILVPAMLHIDPMVFMDYPPALKLKMRGLLTHYIAAGGAQHGSG